MDHICIGAVVVTVLLTLVFMNGQQLGIQPASAAPAYVNRLFDAKKVHQIDLVTADWAGFLASATKERYTACTVVIDGEAFSNVGLRAKGNNSLHLTEEYGLNRYSLKLEFDHYTQGSYYGLDKLSLDCSFQDNSYLKTFLTMDMMAFMGVPTPLTSYVWVTVNGEPWGLYLAVEEPEEAFCRRNFGASYGQLYKPDYKSLDLPNRDVALQYIDDRPDSYDNIFRNAKFNVTPQDKTRLIHALKILSTGENLSDAVDIDEVLRYFTVQVFVVNLDSYLGPTGHNYFLYEENGILQMLPWDYNLAFATYSLGMPKPINDAALYINYPIHTPAAGSVMRNRPLYHHLMLQTDIFRQYQATFDTFITDYFESGRFQRTVTQTADMIAPFVEKDPTAFCSYTDHKLAVDTITQFCNLRAKSVRGQLEGTIPATIQGQQRDKSAFIVPEGVWLPDMGEVADLEK